MRFHCLHKVTIFVPIVAPDVVPTGHENSVAAPWDNGFGGHRERRWDDGGREVETRQEVRGEVREVREVREEWVLVGIKAAVLLKHAGGVHVHRGCGRRRGALLPCCH